MKKGDTYYYTGDMANSSDFGIIEDVYTNRWGHFFSGRLEDGREQKGIPTIAFDKGAGQRFVLMAQYNKERKQALNNLQKRWR